MASLGTFLKTAPRDRALEGKRGQRKLLDTQGSPPPNSRNIHAKEQGVTQKSQEAYRDEKGDPGKTQTQKESIQSEEAGTGRLEGVQRHCLSMQKCSQESQSPPGATTSEKCQE